MTSKKNIYVKFAVLAFLLIYLSQSKCENMLEKSGNCTKCPSNKFLLKGQCYSKIRGCQDYFSQKICLSCQSGYVFNQGSCIKQAIFYKIQKSDIPPVKINIQGSLTFADIQQRIGQSRKQMFQQINRHFKQKYITNLSSCTITNVKYIQTINGIIFTIYYRSLMSIYQAIAFIDSKKDSKRHKTITQVGFQQKLSIPNYSLQQIHSSILKNYQSKLKQCILSTIQKVENNRYRFNYLNTKGEKYECLINRQPFEEIQQLRNVKNIYDLEDILVFVFNMYPQLKSYDFEIVKAPYFTNSNNVQGIYVILFDQKFQITVQNKKQQFNLLSYKNLQIIKQQEQENLKKQKQASNKQASEQTNEKDTYSPFQDLLDPVFLQVWRHFITEYPKYQSYQIVSVLSKKVSGTKFIIHAKTPKNFVPIQSIKSQIYYSLNDPISMEQLEIDGQKINLCLDNYKESQSKQNALEKLVKSGSDAAKSYNYKEDPQFSEIYRFLLEKVKIANTIPIIKVDKTQTEDHIDYQIIFSDKEIAKVRKLKTSLKLNITATSRRYNSQNVGKTLSPLPDTSSIQVLTYIIDGKDLVSGKTIQTVSEENSFNTQVIDFIIRQKPQIFSKNYLIQSFKVDDQNHKKYVDVAILTPQGSYKVQVDVKKPDQFRMNSLVLASQQNCYQYLQSDLHGQLKQDQLIKVSNFLKNNYGLNGAIFQLIQAQVTQRSKRFRVLYTDSQKRKLDILLENYQGKYIVIDSLVLEDGYMNIDIGNKQGDSAQALAVSHYNQFIKDCQIKARLSNTTHIKIIYSCKSKGYEYVYTIANKSDKLQLVFKRNQTQEHQVSINKDKLVTLKQIVKDSKFLDIDRAARKKFSEYIEKSQITAAEKDSLAGVQGRIFFMYKIYYKTSLGGHYACQASWSDGQIKLLNFYLATFQSNTNCQIVSEQQGSKQCIKCLSGYRQQYGNCYQIVQYCQTQIGTICVKCDKKSILKDGKCIRSCKKIFAFRSSKQITKQM